MTGAPVEPGWVILVQKGVWMLGSGKKRTKWPSPDPPQLPADKKRGGGSMKQTLLHLVSIFLDGSAEGVTQKEGQPNCLVRTWGRDDFSKS